MSSVEHFARHPHDNLAGRSLGIACCRNDLGGSRPPLLDVIKP